MTTSGIKQLTQLGSLDVDGRYIFDVTKAPSPQRYGCYPDGKDFPRGKEMLTLSTNMFDIYGGQAVRLQGACAHDVSGFRCGFARKTPSGVAWTYTPVIARDAYTAVCLTPRTPEVEVGWTQMTLSTDNGVSYSYVSDVYFGTTASSGSLEQLDFTSSTKHFWLHAKPQGTITVSWNSDTSFGGTLPVNATVELSLTGYKNETVIRSFAAIQSMALGIGSKSITFSPASTQCIGESCDGVMIGQFVLRIKQSEQESLLKTLFFSRTEISSVLMPIAWYTNDYNNRSASATPWYEQQCNATAGALAEAELPQCPCTSELADVESRLFFPAPDCRGPFPSDVDCMFSPGAFNCYTSLPTSKGYSIRCCYNREGFLMQPQSAPLDGSLMLPDAVNSNYDIFNLPGKYTEVSFQLSHVKNLFSCCSASLLDRNVLPKQCTSMTYARAVSKSCGGFTYSAWSATVGDPHFVTSDGAKYTFNGVGEYWYMFSRTSEIDTKIQVRFEKTITKDTPNAVTNATVLSAIAFQFQGSKVEIHVQPPSIRKIMGSETTYLMVLVDGKEQLHNTLDQRFHKNFKLIADKTQRTVTAIAYDNGPLIRCRYIEAETRIFAAMSCQISLPYKYRNQVRGLSGNMDGNKDNDLLHQNGFTIANPEDPTAVHQFGLSWSVSEYDSLFTYFDDSWYLFNKEVETFVPHLIVANITDPNGPCGNFTNSRQCQYDLQMTKSQDFAFKTLTDLNAMDDRRKILETQAEPQCSLLEIPYTVINFPQGYAVGAKANATGCASGYDPTEGVAFPVEFVCVLENNQNTIWSPTPSSLCRSPEKIYGQLIGATPLDPQAPFDPILLPSSPTIRNSGGIKFGGRQVQSLTLVAKSGCISFKASTKTTHFEDSSATDDPLICPLLASHATDKPPVDVNDPYKILFGTLNATDVNLVEITRDIQSASDGLDITLDTMTVTTAYVFTWLEARPLSSSCHNQTSCNAAERNTYEVIVALTNLGTTYAIFNYQKISWSGYTSSAGTPALSFGVLNYGDSKEPVKLPFADKSTTELQKLITSGTLRGVPGRFIYRVYDTFDRIGCYDSSINLGTVEPLTLNTYVADVFGSRRFVHQSVCLPADVSTFSCGFRVASEPWKRTKLHRLNAYSAACQTPRMPDVDIGELTMAVSFDNGATWKFTERIYLGLTVEDRMPIKLTNNLEWFKAVPDSDLRVEWSPSLFTSNNHQLDMYIFGYKGSAGDYTRKEFYIGAAYVHEAGFIFNSKNVDCGGDCDDMLIGQVVARVHDEAAWQDRSLRYVEISSSIVPIGWFVNEHNRNKTGSAEWYYSHCEAKSVTVDQVCPCSGSLARSDYRAFVETRNCNVDFGSECIVAPQSTKCYSTLPLTRSPNGEGLLCCYDSYDSLVYGQDSPYGGSYALEHALTAGSMFDNADAMGYLSYYMTHSKNLFACCSAKGNNSFDNAYCYNFTEAHSVAKTCTKYATSGVATVVGDPHFFTPDGTVYTFNGVGEYWWVYDSKNSHRRIQVRFQNRFKSSEIQQTGKTLRATVLTAIAFQLDTTVVQIEVQGPSYQFNGGRKLALYVNQAERVFSEYPSVLYLRGMRIESSPDQREFRIQSPYHGPSFHCVYELVSVADEAGSMACTIFLPPNSNGTLIGLTGTWDRNRTNDLLHKPTPSTTDKYADANNMTQVHDYGLTWHVPQTDSVFVYRGTSYAEVNANVTTFVPELTMKPTSSLNQTTIDITCQPGRQFSERCEYDYRITLSSTLAQMTRTRLGEVSSTQSSLANPSTAFCPLLDLPYGVKEYSNGIKLGSFGTFIACVEGYMPADGVVTPTYYKCLSTSSGPQWSPTPSNRVCVPFVPSTSTTPPLASSSAATLPPATTLTVTPSRSAASSTPPTTGSSQTPAPYSDPTAEIILGVFLGVSILASGAMVVYFFMVIKPTLAKVAVDTAAAGAGAASGAGAGAGSANSGASNGIANDTQIEMTDVPAPVPASAPAPAPVDNVPVAETTGLNSAPAQDLTDVQVN